MGTKSKIALTAVISAVVTATVTAKTVSFIDRNYSAFISDGSTAAKFSAIENVLKTQYLYDYDAAALEDSAMEAYVDALDEPYTHYYSKDEFSSYMEDIQDGYTGIGVVISANDDNQIEVVSTFEGSPAYEAGILPGDVIKSLDGTDYTGDELMELTTAIKSGTAGTYVNVVITRDGNDVSYDVMRDDIQLQSVDGEMLDNGIGLIHISGFNSAADDSAYDTFTEFKDKVETLRGEGMTKLIIDLRDNPGGNLNIVCNIADMLLPEGVITYTEDKNGNRENYNSDENALGIPMVVLINGNSASASEVLTGALRDYDAATIVGTTSYGKGIVQSVYPFADGSGMSLTMAKYYSPNGTCIHGVGIEPDISVELPDEYKDGYAFMVPHEDDTQLQKAIEVLN